MHQGGEGKEKEKEFHDQLSGLWSNADKNAIKTVRRDEGLIEVNGTLGAAGDGRAAIGPLLHVRAVLQLIATPHFSCTADA